MPSPTRTEEPSSSWVHRINQNDMQYISTQEAAEAVMFCPVPTYLHGAGAGGAFLFCAHAPGFRITSCHVNILFCLVLFQFSLLPNIPSPAPNTSEYKLPMATGANSAKYTCKDIRSPGEPSAMLCARAMYPVAFLSVSICRDETK